MENDNDLKNFINERIKDRGLTVKKLSEISGISLKNLTNLSEGQLDKLPPSPYLHGYILRLGGILGFDGKALWKNFSGSKEFARSGATDKLPENRFARKISKKSVSAAIVIVIVTAYFALRLPDILGESSLEVTYPPAGTTIVRENSIGVEGRLTKGDQVLVNGDPARVVSNDSGRFEKNVLLAPGLNTIEITAKKFLGREVKVVRQVIYEPASASPTVQSF